MSATVFRSQMIIAFAMLLLLVPIGVAESQSSVCFALAVVGQTLTPGFYSNVTVTATYSYYSKTAFSSGSLYDVDVVMSMPSPLQMLGTGRWHYDLIEKQESVVLSFEVYAPTSAIGNSYEGSLTLTYRQVGEISYTQETHTISFGVAEGQRSVRFALDLTGQTLTAGFYSNVTVTATYSYYSKTAFSSGSLYDVDVVMSMPSPLQMLGTGRWHYDLIEKQESVVLSFEVYAPTSAIGNSYEGSLTLTYREVGEMPYAEENHTLGFSVKGWVNMALYGVQVTPASTSPGGNATVSGNVLNSGNTVAYNATVVVESGALDPGASAVVYLGEVDLNIARPFSLFVQFKQNLTEGTYPLTVRLTVVDTERPSSPYVAEEQSQINIRRAVVEPRSSLQTQNGSVAIVFEILNYLYSLFFGSSNLPIPGG